MSIYILPVLPWNSMGTGIGIKKDWQVRRIESKKNESECRQQYHAGVLIESHLIRLPASALAQAPHVSRLPQMQSRIVHDTDKTHSNSG